MANPNLRELSRKHSLPVAACTIQAGLSIAALACLLSPQISSLLGSSNAVQVQAAFMFGLAPTVVVGALLGLARYAPPDMRLFADRLQAMVVGILVYAAFYVGLFIASMLVLLSLIAALSCAGLAAEFGTWLLAFGLAEAAGGLVLLGYLLTGGAAFAGTWRKSRAPRKDEDGPPPDDVPAPSAQSAQEGPPPAPRDEKGGDKSAGGAV